MALVVLQLWDLSWVLGSFVRAVAWACGLNLGPSKRKTVSYIGVLRNLLQQLLILG